MMETLCLESLESSLAKNLVKAQINDKAIQHSEKNGWARELSTDELPTSKNPVYYLPDHDMYHPEKESKPLRVVFDPASPYQGVSLNSFLYKGIVSLEIRLELYYVSEKNLLPLRATPTNCFCRYCHPRKIAQYTGFCGEAWKLYESHQHTSFAV